MPELGTIRARHKPFVVLTSNNARDLSEALKRRCLYLYIDYPDAELERRIVLTKVPGIEEKLARQAVHVVRKVRQLDLKKHPCLAETIDWALALSAMGVKAIDAQTILRTAGALVKFKADQDKLTENINLVRQGL